MADLPANEFYHGHVWAYVSNWANFRDFWVRLEVNSINIGFLLYALEDRAVSVGHIPARPYTHDDNRELIFETTGASNFWTYSYLNLKMSLPYNRNGNKAFNGSQIYSDPYFSIS